MATFNLNTLGCIVDDLDLLPGWNSIHLGQIVAYSDELKEEGITSSDLPEVFNTMNLLTGVAVKSGLTAADPQLISVFADENGVATAAYGPGIFAQDGSLKLFFGDEAVPVEVSGRKVAIGKLTGEVEFSESDPDDKKQRPWVKAVVDLMVGKEAVSLPIVLIKETDGVRKKHLKQAWDDNTFADSYARAAGSASSYIKLKELEVGEYALADIWENEPHPEYGRSWSLKLVGVPHIVNSGGKRFEATLAQLAPLYKKRLANGKAHTLIISSKTEVSTGVAVVAAIMQREPNPAKLKAFAKDAIASSEPAAAALKSAAIDYDDIPY